MTALHHLAADYDRAVRDGMGWLLARPALQSGFIDTKFDPLNLRDHDETAPLAGPGFTYGWIQGRALEALTGHASYFHTADPGLASRIDRRARELYTALDPLVRRDGHAFFCYDPQLTPIIATGDAPYARQAEPGAIRTYSDIFAAKGLLAAATRLGQPDAAGHRARLAETVAAVEQDRFQMDERRRLGSEALADQPGDFGPRMILLGGAGLLRRLGYQAEAAYASRFIDHVLDHHLDPASGLLRNVPGGALSNAGHAIEFAGFALDCLPVDCDPQALTALGRILTASFAAGFTGYGLALQAEVASARPATDLAPWWSLPETVRACALLFERTRDPKIVEIWQQAHEAFFRHFWRGTPPVAYQMRSALGPVGQPPATPDLDPFYHTGLSFLTALDVIGRLTDGA